MQKSWSEGEDLNRHIIIGPEGGERIFPKNVITIKEKIHTQKNKNMITLHLDVIR